MSYLKIAAVSVFLSVAIGAAPAAADTAITGFSGGSSFSGFSGDETVGFQFSTAAPIWVSSLGWYATTGTLNASHDVGIWTLAGDLLGSVTVTAGAADTSGFRFAAISPLVLGAGSYLIGGRDLTTDGDSYVTSASGLTTGTGISFLGAAVSGIGAGFSAPTTVTANSGGRFGANFTFGAGGVPEPSTWAMMLIGFGAFGSVSRFRRRRISASLA